MMSTKFYFFLFIVCLSVITYGQQEDFLRGAFIHSGSGELTLYGNYDQVESLGVNSVHQNVVKDVVRLGQINNFQQLSRFDYIYASNDSGTGSSECDWCNAEPENIDWISYLTQAKYMKWEAEGDEMFTGSVGIKHQGGQYYQETDGTKGWRTYNNSPWDRIIYGPSYWQYPRYTYTNPGWNPTSINYKAVFRMKIDYPSTEALEVCQIMVVMRNPAKGISDTILASLTLTTNDLDVYYKDFVLRYDYKNYIELGEGEHTGKIYPSTISRPFEEIETNPSLNIGAEVQFIVRWLGNRELFIDYIEVYDEQIWENYFSGDGMNQVIPYLISNYVQSFATDPTFYSKLKYFVTIDEPHSIDCYLPIRKVQEILDSLNVQKNLLVHWYPGWSHYRDGGNTWPVYKSMANPKKIMFWYAP